MSHETPQSPGISPCSPTKGHPLNSQAMNTLPPLATSMPLRRSSVIQYPSPIHQSPRNPLGLTIENRKQSIPNLQASIDVVMNTPISPRASLSFPTRQSDSDGSQSRMDVRSPILDKVVALPLRLNTAVAEPSQAVRHYSQSEIESTSSTSSISRSKSRWLSSYSRMAAILRSNTSTSTTSTSSISPRARTRSPIRKRISPSRTMQSPSPRSRSRSHFRTSPRSYTPPQHLRLSNRTSSSPRFPHQSQHQQQVEQQQTPQTPPQQSALSQGFHPTYIPTLTHLRTPLIPLISVSNGLSHPDFPRSLLQYHLLTHDQLDSLARWYHQVSPPVEETFRYPTWIPPWTTAAAAGDDSETDDYRPAAKRTKWNGSGGGNGDLRCESDDTSEGEIALETKRRRWGRFMGLRGCESPVLASSGSSSSSGGGFGNEFESSPKIHPRRRHNRMIVSGDEDSRGGSSSGKGEKRRAMMMMPPPPLPSPPQSQSQTPQPEGGKVGSATSTTVSNDEGLVERMEREWRNALRKAEDEEMLREKGWRGRW